MSTLPEADGADRRARRAEARAGDGCPWSHAAAPHALGADDDGAARAFVAHLEAGCAACAAALEEARLGVAALDAAALAGGSHATEVPSAARLRERLRARSRETAGAVHETDAQAGADAPRAGAADVQAWKRWRDDAALAGALFTLRSDEGTWETTAIPGIRVRRLFADASGRRVTMLVRMEPGTAYPAHRHGGAEECFVLEGDLEEAGRVLRAGDFQRADAGSRHAVQSTRGGCTLLISSSTRDELV